MARGSEPYDDLIEYNGKFYGTTRVGGGYSVGILFSINTDGTNYTKIHDFEGGVNGATPWGALAVSNGKLWGMAGGGSSFKGLIFNIDPDGSNYTVVHNFSNGASPLGGLLESNGKLWGMTSAGGTSNAGIIFSINTDGSNFSKVHDFNTTEGANPYGSLIESNGKLWGTTQFGGSSSSGTIFSLNTDGTSFTSVHSFNSVNGSRPAGELYEIGSELWGTTQYGGTSSGGVLFKLNNDGTGFTKLHDFTNLTGINPGSSLQETAGKVWGLTTAGGSSLKGVIFSINVNGTGYTKEFDFVGNLGENPLGGLTLVGSTLWGTAHRGGFGESAGGNGVLFSIDNTGNNYSVEHYFDDVFGSSPRGTLIEADGKLWGMTLEGGAGFGALYSMDLDGSNFAIRYDFSLGKYPRGSLTYSGGKIWGMTTAGGNFNHGTIFNMDTDGTGYTTVHNFDNTNGSSPYGALYESNGKLWGTTYQGGASNFGTLFSINTNGTGFTKVVDFVINNGRRPLGSLYEYGGKLYGTTESGGASDFYGTIFSLNTDGTGFTVLHSFGATGGRYPKATLVESGGKLWGTAHSGGTNTLGVIFSIDPDGSNYAEVHNFGSQGFYPYSTPVVVGTQLYGLTERGGSKNGGVLWRMDNDGTNFTVVHEISEPGGRSQGSILVVNDKQSQALDMTLSNLTYGDAAFSFGATSGSGNAINYASSDNTVISVLADQGTIEGVGSVEITASQDEDATYYASCITRVIDVSKATLDITAEDLTVEFGEPIPSLSAAYQGFVYSETVTDISVPTIGTTATQGSDVGNYDITLTGGSADNYNINLTSGTLTIEQADLSIVVNDQNREYGDTNPTFTTQVTGFKLSDDNSAIDVFPTVSTTADEFTDVGDYDITATGGSDVNYNLLLTDGTLTIDQAELNASANDETKVYGEPLPTFTISYSGFKNNETESVIDITPVPSTTATASSDVGFYEISLAPGSDLNYFIIESPGELEIIKADQTIDFGSLAPVSFDDGSLELSATATSGLAVTFSSGDNLIATISGTTVTFVMPGTVTISADQAGDINHNAAARVDQSLTINEVLDILSELDSEIEVYPNPAKNYFQLDRAEMELTDLLLVNIRGEIVRQFNIQHNGYYRLNGISAGNYLLMLKSSEGDLHVKRLTIRD